MLIRNCKAFERFDDWDCEYRIRYVNFVVNYF